MIPTTTSTADAVAGGRLAVPDELRRGAERATELLELELGDLVETFGVRAGWGFYRDPAGAVVGDLAIAGTRFPGFQVSVECRGFTAETFRDDDRVRRHLSPAVSKFARLVMAFSHERIKTLTAGLQKSIEALATVEE